MYASLHPSTQRADNLIRDTWLEAATIIAMIVFFATIVANLARRNADGNVNSAQDGSISLHSAL